MSSYSLTLENLTILVKLGCFEEERAQPQRVTLHLVITFANRPLECVSDNINDAICYAKLSQAIQVFCADKSFNLIETLGYQLYGFVKEQLPANVKLALRVIKNPPIPNLDQCIFSVSD